MAHAYDVIVIGGGYTGNLMAMVLRQKGYTVAVIESAAFPRFAIGESTTPEQNRMHAHLSRRYRIPELLALSSYPRIKAHRLPLPTWPKESFYFLMNQGTPGTDCGRPQELVHQSHAVADRPRLPHDSQRVRSVLLRTRRTLRRAGPGGSPTSRTWISPGRVTVVAENAEGTHELHGRFLVDRPAGRPTRTRSGWCCCGRSCCRAGDLRTS